MFLPIFFDFFLTKIFSLLLLKEGDILPNTECISSSLSSTCDDDDGLTEENDEQVEEDLK